MLAEAGGAVNETTATAIKGKNLLNAYFMKLPTLFTKLFRIAPCRAKCVNSSIICCSAFISPTALRSAGLTYSGNQVAIPT